MLLSHLNRQETKFAKEVTKIAKPSWRHEENLGVLRILGG
jgi:hypothetical protein